MNTGWRQSMTWLHTWIGLILCWVMYFMFVTGTTGYFDDEIDQYMTPEIEHHAPATMEQRFISLMEYGNTHALAAQSWFLRLEAQRSGLLSRIFYRVPDPENPDKTVSHNTYIDPRTGHDVTDIARDTAGGQTLYRMHWRLHYIDSQIAYYLIGIVTLFMFIGVVSGIVIHRKIFTDFFTFRAQKNGKGWLDAHNLVSVTSLPFQLMISYSGLLFMVTTFLPLIGYGSFGFDEKATRQAVQDLRPQVLVEKSGTPAPMLSPDKLFEKINAQLDLTQVTSIQVKAPGDANAVVVVRVSESIYGARTAQSIVFSAITGDYIESKPRAVNAAMQFNRVMLDLHEGIFASTELRWLYFVAGLLGATMMATGAIYYVRKRRVKLGPKASLPRYLRNIEATNIAVIVGLVTSIAVFFIANRLLPIDLENRADWEMHCLFISWFACFVHAYCRPASKAWFEQLYFAGICYLSLPFINVLMIDQHLINAIADQNWVFAGTDLLSLLLAGVFFYIASQLQQKSQMRQQKSKHSRALNSSQAERAL